MVFGVKRGLVGIHIYKLRRLILIVQSGRLLQSFPVGLGPSPVGTKRRQGDGKTPEGHYYVCTRNARSKYTLFLGISYPSPADAAPAFFEGTITKSQLQQIKKAHEEQTRPPWDTPLGGEIGIHGGAEIKDGVPVDNTAGCIAVSDDDIQKIWTLADLGSDVIIYP